MFHKALWMHSFKNGKWGILAFWLVMLYFLPYTYYQAAAEQLYMKQNWGTLFQSEDPYYYSYSFNASESLILQVVALVLLAVLLVGRERSNGTMDVLFAMPFRRKDIFLVKWLFGFVNITAAHLVCYGLMYVIKITTIHDEYQNFTYFSKYFLVAYITLTGVYSFCLFIGTITDNAVSQTILSGIFLILPYGLYVLIESVIMLHTHAESMYYSNSNIASHLAVAASLPFQLLDINISFDLNPAASLAYMHMYSLYMLLSPILYTIVSLWLGVKLYSKTPNEANGKILLFSKLTKVFVPCVVICCSLLAGVIFSNKAIPVFYISAAIAGGLSYFILKKLLSTRLTWNVKQ